MRIITLILLLSAFSLGCFAQEVSTDLIRDESTEFLKEKEKPVKLTPDGEARLPSIWMQQKHKNAQKIFAGMVEGDLFAVEDAARHMQFLNRLENFVRAKDKGYRTQLNVFQFATKEIFQGAKDKNLDRVTLGYNQMTLSCVACHKQMRGEDTASSKPTARPKATPNAR